MIRVESATDGIPRGDLVLDIGDGVGALVIYTGRELRGVEVEITLMGDEGSRTHTVVQEHRAGDRTLFAGVFPALPAGDYRISTDDPKLPAVVTIVSGQVAEIDWR